MLCGSKALCDRVKGKADGGGNDSEEADPRPRRVVVSVIIRLLLSVSGEIIGGESGVAWSWVLR